MTDFDTLKQIRLFLPKYLSPERQEELWAELRAFPDNRHLYSERSIDATLLQGDGWRGFVAIDFHTSERKHVHGVVLSNSCDVNVRVPEILTPTFPEILAP